MQEIRSNIWLIGLCLLCAGGALSLNIASSHLTESFVNTSESVPKVESGDDRCIGSTDDALFLVDTMHGDSEAVRTSVASNVTDLAEPLRRLHETALIAFEFAPNFGYMRMPPLIQESTPPQHVPLLASQFETLEKDNKSPADDPNPSSAWMWINEMTGICSQGFVYRPTKVHIRKWRTLQNNVVDRLVYGYPDPKCQSSETFADEFAVLPDQTELWRVSSIELIGLWQRESPVVFEQRPTTGFRNLKSERVPTRNVNLEEAAAVSRLQNDAQLVATFDEDTSNIRLVGAIRAKQSCVKCHDATEGALLGAFTYEIEPQKWPEGLATK